MLRFLTAGESHGRGLVAIIEGMVAGLRLTEGYIARDLVRRQRGYGRGGRMQIERDRAEILSGVRHGLTMGSPIALFIRNRDWENWRDVMSLSRVQGIEPVTRLRPGHADLPGVVKYGQDDVRPILERASARETAARVAVGAVARKFLEAFGIRVHSYVLAIGGVEAGAKTEGPDRDWAAVERSPVRCSDAGAERAMMAAIDEAKAAGDTLGGIFEVVATGVPPGLGSHVHWDRRLNGSLAQALMSIHAVKGVEVGAGFALAGLKGSGAHDVIFPGSTGEPGGVSLPWHRDTNRAGGMEGGMTNGEPIVMRAAVKPIATLAHPLPSVDLRTGEKVEAHFERSDVCIVPAAGVVGEAAVAIVLAGAILEKFGGDHLKETRRGCRAYLKTTAAFMAGRKGKPRSG
ncbi:MAG: chorismate synthase [Dehalococcoidia bacterium]